MLASEKLMRSARQKLRQRRPADAARVLGKLLREEPENVEAMALYGKVLIGLRKYSEASAVLAQATRREPKAPQLWASLGLSLIRQRKYDDALHALQHALRLQPQDAMNHFLMAESYAAIGRLNDASHAYQRAINCRPGFTAAHRRHGEVLRRAGAFDAAILEYKNSLELDPRQPEVMVDLGNALRQCDRIPQAIECFESALKLDPTLESALNNLSNTLRDKGELQRAQRCAAAAVAAAPESHVCLNTLGLAEAWLGNYEPAEQAFLAALEKRPDYANAHYNLGSVCLEKADLKAAKERFNRALECNPEHAEAAFRLGCIALQRGEFERGWPLYEKRWEMKETKQLLGSLDCNRWDGADIAGKRMLLLAEQGIGDTLQFIRYAKVLAEQGASVSLQCPERLASIVSSAEGLDAVSADFSKEGAQFDYYAPLLSLPGLCKTTVETIPSHSPYLHANDDLIASWRKRVDALPGDLKIGIAWQGARTYLRDRSRSVPLSEFARLGELPGVTLVSLQKGAGREQVGEFGGDSFVDFSDELDQGDSAFVDTAAVIQCLDLVITSDTSIAHLAGGLGARVWLALGYMPEWRWLLERDDSPWYPTMQLFRQPQLGDWPSVFEAIQQQLVHHRDHMAPA